MNIKSRIQSTTANYNSNIVDNVHKTSNSNINKKGNFRYLVSAPSIPKDSKVAINNSNMGMNKGREVTNLL
jgi:hypothetical protein